MTPVETKQSTSTAQCDEESVVQCVVERVADELGKDPLELPVLHEVVDTDALSALIDGRSDDLCVTFRYAGCLVEITGDGAVTVTA